MGVGGFGGRGWMRDEILIPNVLGIIACNKAEVEWAGVRRLWVDGVKRENYN